MGYGKSWPHGPIPKGHVVMEQHLAQQLGLREGDAAVLSVFLKHALTEAFLQAALPADQAVVFHVVNLVVTVAAIAAESHGKLANDKVCLWERAEQCPLFGMPPLCVRLWGMAVCEVQGTVGTL